MMRQYASGELRDEMAVQRRSLTRLVFGSRGLLPPLLSERLPRRYLF
jgi:hypothetical protein